LEEKQQIKALRRKDTLALESLIDQYTPYVATVIYRIIGRSMSAEDVEEVVSDVFYALWCNADKLKAGKLKSYLGAIARNRAKNKLREMGKTIPLEDEIFIIAPDSPEQTAEEREQAATLRHILLSMEQPEQEIFIRYYYYSEKISSIAEEMGINESTVKSKLKRGRTKVRVQLLEGGFYYAY
jgi:RNA polymerase sigma-70 factor (ECF subfamily)